MDPLARLFERWRARGDVDALGAVFDRAAPRLLGLALHLSDNPADAEDLLQQTFLTAIRSAAAFDAARPLEPWLVGLLTHAAHNHRRRERHRQAAELPDLPDLAEAPAPAAERSEQIALLRTHIEALPQEQRQVLLLQLQHGLQPIEIAEVLGVAPGTVRMRIHRGLQALRRLLPAGLAGCLIGVLSARGLAAVRGAVLREAANWATMAAPAAFVVIGGMLLMKKVLWIAALVMTVLLVGAAIVPTFWPGAPARAPEPAPIVLTAAGDVREARAPGTRTELGLDRTPVPAGAAAGSLRVRLVGVVSQETAPGEETAVWDGSGGEPVADMPVFVQPQGDPDPLNCAIRARTDDNGEAQFAGLAPGTWTITAQTLSAEAKGEVLVAAGQQADATLPVVFRWAIDGLVVDGDGWPVSDAEIWTGFAMLGDVRPLDVVARCTQRSDAAGRFRVLAGRLDHVSARKAGYAESFSHLPWTGGQARLVLGMEPGGLVGSVVDQGGRPVAGATVTLVYQQAVPGQSERRRTADGRECGAPVPLLAWTDGDGRFALEGLMPGSYRLSVEDRRHFPRSQNLAVEKLVRNELRIELQAQRELRGRIVHPAGDPAVGLVLDWIVEGGRRANQVNQVTRADGTFVLSVPERPFRLQARRGDHVVAEQAFALPLPLVVELVADEQQSLAGRLVGDGGAGLAGWRVTATAGNAAVKTFTGPDGAFAFWQLGCGPFAVHAHPHDREQPRVERPGVVAGTTDLRLEVPAASLPTGRISGVAVDWRGSEVVAEVDLIDPQKGPVPPGAPPAGDGSFAFEGLFPGDYVLDVRADRCASRRLACTVGAATPVDLGRIVLGPGAELRVRTRSSNGETWSGPPVRPELQTEAGTWLKPWPRPTIEGDEVVLRGLAAGRYRLLPPAHDEVLAEHLTIEVAEGGVLRVDWPVALGLRRVLVFPGVDRNIVLEVVVRDGSGREVLAQVLAPASDPVTEPQIGRLVDAARSERALERVFAFGSYEVTALASTGQRYRATFAVGAGHTDPARIEVPAVR